MALRDIDFQKSIDTAIERLEDLDSILIIVEAEALHETSIHLVRELLKRDMYGIYLSLNKPHTTLKSAFHKQSIDINRVYFIDCVTALAHKTLTKHDEHVIYATSPQDLKPDGSIPCGVIKFTEAIDGEKFLVIDALRTLFIYNEPHVVSTFIHSVLDLTKKHDLKVIVLTRKEDEEFLHLMSNAMGDVITI